MKEKETQVSVEAVRCSYLDFERLAHMFSEKIRKEGLLNEMRSDDSLARTLFLCVLVNLLPVVFASSFVKGFHRTSLYSIVVGAAFATQCLILLRFFFERNGLKVTRRILVAWVFSVPYLLTLLMSALSRGILNPFDLINVAARFISVSLLYVFPYEFSFSENGLKRFMTRIVVLACIASVYNTAINFRGILNIRYIASSYEVRFSSFFLNRNSFGQFLLFGMMANSLLWMKVPSARRWLVATYVLFAVNLFATLSRTAMLSCLVFFSVFSFGKSRKKAIYLFVVLMASVTLILLVEITQFRSEFIRNIVLRLDVGTTGRISIWREGLEILSKTSWVFGTGYLLGRQFLVSGTQFHSFLIEALVGGGLVELIILFTFLMLLIMGVLRNLKGFDRDACVFYSAAYAAFLCYSVFESPSFFSMGFVDTVFTVFFVTVPLVYSRRVPRSESVSGCV